MSNKTVAEHFLHLLHIDHLADVFMANCLQYLWNSIFVQSRFKGLDKGPNSVDLVAVRLEAVTFRSLAVYPYMSNQ